MALPNELFYVLVKPGGKPLGYRQKGGGTYTKEDWGRNQFSHLKHHGSKVELYAGHIEWTLIESSEQADDAYTEDTLW